MSSHSSPEGNNCVELAGTALGIVVRDSKNPDGDAIAFGAASWRTFMAGVKTGAHDG
jgi:hypothetical protein